MIAYNKTSLNNFSLHEEVKSALHNDCISKEEAAAIENKYPVDLYTPNLFIRIGLFLLTTVITLMGYGILCLMLLSGSEKHFGIMTFIYALMIYGGLEFFIREKKHFRSGIDDALIWCCLISLITAVNLINESLSFMGQSLLIFIPAFYFLLRFGNVIMGGLTFLSFLSILFFGVIKFGDAAKTIMPFLLMTISFLVYWFVRKYKQHNRLQHYRSGLTLIEILALIVLYVAGNYFAVRETSNSMFDLGLKENESIPAGWFFWILTVLLPLVYIFKGLQKKDVILLRTGLLLVAAIVFTVRYYHHVAPLEVAMTIGGIIMIALAYFTTKYLNTPKYGFTHAEPNDPQLNGLLQLESLIVTETFHKTVPAEADNKFDFGGGSTGGAGATDRF